MGKDTDPPGDAPLNVIVQPLNALPVSMIVTVEPLIEKLMLLLHATFADALNVPAKPVCERATLAR
jgi:hypothetical protein